MTVHQPRAYQAAIEQGVHAEWRAGKRNVLAVLPTGGGKTFVMARLASASRAACAAVAHRAELVSQMSVAFAREGVRHRVIGPEALARQCTQAHMVEFGRPYYDPNAAVAICSVDTLVRMDKANPWLRQVLIWFMDEAHHVLEGNKWGDACNLFPNAYGLGVTATPTRADGKGLGRTADGLFDAMVVGPPMRELIDAGYLTDYRVFCPPSDIDLSKVTITDSGDFSPPKLRDARHKSKITGDVVEHYLRLARGKLGVTFDVDVESAVETAAAYRAAGVPAEVVSAKTPWAVRAQVLQRFRRREVLQLVNVDLFGEGFDLPAIEVVSMARPTQSYGLFAQQFGRALRPLDGKDKAIIIDHVGNVVRHGLPDAPRRWSLDRRERRSRSSPSDVILLRNCLNAECLAAYERVLVCCPFCGTEPPPPADRSSPDKVEGDLTELDPAVLRALRGERDRIDAPAVFPEKADHVTRLAINKRHVERQAVQAELRAAIALWAGWQNHLGRGDREASKRFYQYFGVDVLSATTLRTSEAAELQRRIEDVLRNNGVVAVSRSTQ